VGYRVSERFHQERVGSHWNVLEVVESGQTRDPNNFSSTPDLRHIRVAACAARRSDTRSASAFLTREWGLTPPALWPAPLTIGPAICHTEVQIAGLPQRHEPKSELISIFSMSGGIS